MAWCSVSLSCDSPILCFTHTGTRTDCRRSHFWLKKKTHTIRLISQRAILCELWREADIAEQHRLENKAKGLSQNDFEEPLPIGALDGYLDKFEAFYHYRPFFTEILAEPLVGRLKREIDRKTFTVLPLARVRNNKESPNQAMGKRASPSPRTWLSSSVRTRFPSASGRSMTTTSPCTSVKSSGKWAGRSPGTSSTPTAASSPASKRARPTFESLRKQPRPWDDRTPPTREGLGCR